MYNNQSVRQCKCKICRGNSDPKTQLQHHQINLVMSRLNEAQRRWYAGFLSQQPNSPNQRQLSQITGLDVKTIRRGREELEQEFQGIPSGRQRKVGGGRYKIKKRT